MLGTEIFWLTILFACLVSIGANIIGRFLFNPFPFKLRVFSRFYLGQAAGLSFLVIYAMYLGRFFTYNNVWAYKVGLLLVSLVAVYFEKDKLLLIKNSIFTLIFTLICGICVLVPLYIWGEYNIHNDAVTYLVHGNWLQTHLFGETILDQDVTPALTQIAMYQRSGFRMGGSYLLGLVQGLFGVKDALFVFPALLIVATASCFRAVGFSLRSIIAKYSYMQKTQLLALPALTVGGFVFAATFGFMPQVIGSTSTVLIFSLSWPLIESLVKGAAGIIVRLYQLALFALFFSAAVTSYSEMTPFILVSLAVAILVFALKNNSWRWPLSYSVIIIALAGLFLNAEIFRILKALKIQSGAIVGSPVDWTLVGYLAHMIGIHGGAWDIFQWDLHREYKFLFLAILIFGYVFRSIGKNKNSLESFLTELKVNPAYLTFIFLMCLGLIYFRYFVKNPFFIGTGQSWSQFKLANWSHPFVSFIIILAFAIFLESRKRAKSILLGVFLVAVVSSSYSSIMRAEPIVSYYGVKDIAKFYGDFRKESFALCGSSDHMYLSLGGGYNKFRQVAAVYLADMNVVSDWIGDDYVYADLPDFRKSVSPKIGECTVAASDALEFKAGSVGLGKFKIGFTSDGDRVGLAKVQGGYPKENDGANWWYWFAKHLEFYLPEVEGKRASGKTQISFDYIGRSQQTLSMRIILYDGTSVEEKISIRNQQLQSFHKSLGISYSMISQILFDSDGVPQNLSDGDYRKATTMIRNLKLAELP